MNWHVLSGALTIVLSGARVSCYQAQERAQVIGASSESVRVTPITRSFGSAITSDGRSLIVDRSDLVSRGLQTAGNVP